MARFAALAAMASALLLLPACQSTDLLEIDPDSVLPVATGIVPSFKDERFRYRTPLEIRDGEAYALVPYDEQLDINQRDEIPVRKVRSAYTEALAEELIHDLDYTGGEARQLKVLAAGKPGRPALLTVIYLHGRDGDRTWGFDDERFGGNFNRLKNLVTAANGLYLSPDFTDFQEAGVDDIAALIDQLAPPAGKVILACGSMGTALCWKLLESPETARRISGLVLLGGFPDNRFVASADPDGQPVVIAHGNEDSVYPVSDMEAFYEALYAKGHPVRMRVFETGNHGTPVRMIDWRDSLNWITRN